MEQIKLGKRLIGEYSPITETIYKKVQFSKHRFKATDSWGVDNKRIIEKYPDHTKIVIDDTEQSIKYTATVGDYKEKGHFYHFKDQKNDHEVQRFLKREFFKQEKKVLSEDQIAENNYLMGAGLPKRW